MLGGEPLELGCAVFRVFFAALGFFELASLALFLDALLLLGAESRFFFFLESALCGKAAWWVARGCGIQFSISSVSTLACGERDEEHDEHAHLPRALLWTFSALSPSSLEAGRWVFVHTTMR